MGEKTYNGWTNYETWAVNLWLSNDEGSYRYCTELAQECYDAAVADQHFTRKERALIALAEKLKDEHEEGNPLTADPKKSAGVYVDLLNAAISEVNWGEIAAAWIEDVEEEEEEEAEQVETE